MSDTESDIAEPVEGEEHAPADLVHEDEETDADPVLLTPEELEGPE